MKNIFKYSIILVIFAFLSILSTINGNAQEIKVNTDNDLSSNKENIFLCGQYISLDYENVPYNSYEDVIINFEIFSSSIVEQINYNNVGFENIKLEQVLDNKITVILQFSNKNIKHSFQLIVKLSNNEYIDGKIYGYKSNNNYFLSEASEANKDLLFYQYQLENEIISLEEYNKEVIHKTSVSMPNETYTIIKKDSKIQNSRSVSNEPVSSIVSGTCSWFDGTNYHPLRNTLVFVSYPILGTTNGYATYTNSNGEFLVELMLTESVEITIQIQSTSPNVEVKPGALNSPHSVSRGPIYLEPGDDIIDYIFNIEPTYTAHKAFVVLQALEYGANYVKAITGVTPSFTDCHYPKNNNRYMGLDIIEIEEEAYEYWDIILHEYGHKIAYYFDFTDNIGFFSHYFGKDLISAYGKNQGTIRAWHEGVATYFGTVVTHYYGNELTGLDNVNDHFYNSYSITESGGINPWYENLEENEFSGEGCEGTVVSVLYDLFDSYSSSESWDNISLGHSIIFNSIINSNAVTLSEFTNYFITNVIYPNDGRIGAIYSNHSISAKKLSITPETGTASIPPVIVWEVGGTKDSVENNSVPNNNFYLVIYDNNDSVIATTGTQNVNATNVSTTSSYTFSSTLWNQLMGLSSSYITISVVASQTDSPSTGPYYSEKIRIDIPHIHNYTHSYTQSGPLNHIAYCSCGISITESHIFQPFKNGNRCTKCLYFTTGPVIIQPIMGISNEIMYIEEKKKENYFYV